MKVYLIKEADLERLFLMVDRDPKRGAKGGSSAVFSKEQEEMFDEVCRFYNYQVRTWADQIKKDTE